MRARVRPSCQAGREFIQGDSRLRACPAGTRCRRQLGCAEWSAAHTPRADGGVKAVGCGFAARAALASVRAGARANSRPARPRVFATRTGPALTTRRPTDGRERPHARASLPCPAAVASHSRGLYPVGQYRRAGPAPVATCAPGTRSGVQVPARLRGPVRMPARAKTAHATPPLPRTRALEGPCSRADGRARTGARPGPARESAGAPGGLCLQRLFAETRRTS